MPTHWKVLPSVALVATVVLVGSPLASAAETLVPKLRVAHPSSPLPQRPPAAIPELRIARIEGGAVVVDGDLSEPAWRKAEHVEQWFETGPGDNVPPKVKTIAYLAYDDRYLYVAVECLDPDPTRIRSALGDRDAYGLSDAVGIYLDTRNEGKTAFEFWVNAGGSQFDGIFDDVTDTEDGAADFFWDSAARLTATGWIAEVRIPFSTLRYSNRNPEAWRLMVNRNYPRDFWYHFSTTTLPRGSSCYVCRANPLRGLRDLPTGGGLVAAPYLSARRSAEPEDDPGSPLVENAATADGGADLKWTPRPDHAVDATLNPDFSQIESDVALIGANERFALYYPEKRPFFLEGRELLATPIQAVHTRTVTAPRWGARATGRAGGLSYAVLGVRDEGGGSAIIPGSTESSLAHQNFSSDVWVGRLRLDFGGNFVGLLATDREVEGGGSNRVAGPDFQWRPGRRDVVTGQLLWGTSQTPARPELAEEWDGRSLSGYGGSLRWVHTANWLDWHAEYKDASDEFRADDGFVPQVGYRQAQGEAGWTFYPQGVVRRLRVFALGTRSTDRKGAQLGREFSTGVNLSGLWSSSVTARVAEEHLRVGDRVLPQTRLIFAATMRPLGVISQVSLSGSLGEAIDFMNERTANGADLALTALIRPSRHLEINLNASWRALDVDPGGDDTARLFTAEVGRLRATYHFSPRSFARLVAQRVETRRDPKLYSEPVRRFDSSAIGSLLFAYRLNWQTALWLGYGDERSLSEDERLEPAKRELFLKVSYAFQH